MNKFPEHMDCTVGSNLFLDVRKDDTTVAKMRCTMSRTSAIDTRLGNSKGYSESTSHERSLAKC